MKIQKPLTAILIVAGLSCGLISQVVMANGGDGTLNFSGSVIDAACTVAPDSKNMTVDLGNISLSGYLSATTPDSRYGKNITINLTDCPETIASASVLLTGKTAYANGSGYADAGLAIDGGNGAATGIMIMFTNVEKSDTFAVNSDLIPFSLTKGDNKLQFMAALWPANKGVAATAGTISATAQYNIVYP
ncbi:fimbrial protein (plasmid) [Hafnia alvei]|uniref:fimbrial protein n=1 Tax=Hafnia alvei TaxID=569 RepID=UPI000B6ABE8B|nr:fimbrial protein [Hafnia alvei]MBI0278569.1 fimbrial protein [Hafnia alvei]PNL03867.1 hypothetical protein CEQ28_000165 [Hafnia alvei]